MKFSTSITAFLAAGSAVASPVVAGETTQVVARAETGSFGELSSQLETIKGLVEKDFSSCKFIMFPKKLCDVGIDSFVPAETPSASDVTDITDRIDKLITGLVPLDLEGITGGDLLQLLDVLGNLDGIVGGLTSTLPTEGLQTRQLSYAPLIEVLYPLLTSVSELVSGVLNTVYGAVGSTAAREDSELTQKLLSGTSGLSRDTGSLFGLLGGLGDLLPIGN